MFCCAEPYCAMCCISQPQLQQLKLPPGWQPPEENDQCTFIPKAKMTFVSNQHPDRTPFLALGITTAKLHCLQATGEWSRLAGVNVATLPTHYQVPRQLV
jgi:hypothetical protein